MNNDVSVEDDELATQINRLVGTAVLKNDKNYSWEILKIIKQREHEAELRGQQGMWIVIHDIFRDKPDTFPIQEAINAASEAYKIETNEDIDDWLTAPTTEDTATDGGE